MELSLFARLPLWYTLFLKQNIGQSLSYQVLAGLPGEINGQMNPFHLRPAQAPRAVLVTWDLHYHLGQIGFRESFYREVQKLGLPVVGLENQDLFHLKFRPSDCARFDMILKAQGVYRDRELYNYKVGGRYGHYWTEKHLPLETSYKTRDLEKLRVSFPVFVVRTHWLKKLRLSTRNLVNQLVVFNGRPRYTVCFLAAMNHVRRFDALKRMQDAGISFTGGLVNLGETAIAGYEEIFHSNNSRLNRRALYDEIAERGLWRKRVGGFGYQRRVLSSRACLAVAGHGELGVRHTDALENGRLLICQDLRHAEILYPFKPGENVLFCAHDLSDLGNILKDVDLDDRRKYRRIARCGYEDWSKWARDKQSILERGFWNHIHELV